MNSPSSRRHFLASLAVLVAAPRALLAAMGRKPEPPAPVADDPNTFYSTRDGNWNDPAMWSRGEVPGTGAKIVLRHEARFDGTVEMMAQSLGVEPVATPRTLDFSRVSRLTANGLYAPRADVILPRRPPMPSRFDNAVTRTLRWDGRIS